jgi:hypothetical protein
MTYAEFQERWKIEAGKEYDLYVTLQASALASRVRRGEFGEYFTIWRAVAARCRLAEVRDAMMKILTSDVDYLIRYHCAEALISLSGAYSDGFRAVQLSGREKYDVDRHLAEFASFLDRLDTNAEPGGE